MKTIYQLQEIANRLRAATETASISPEDAFGLLADVLEYLADMEQNAEGLGIHSIYNSYDEMVADASAPVGSNRKPLRFGQLVVIYDPSDNTKPETGNIYAWQKGNTGEDAWLLMGNMKGIHDFSMKIDTLLHNVSIEEKAREEADTAITARVDKSLFTLDSSYEEESVTIYGYSDKDSSTPIANADIDAATHEKAGVMSAEDKVMLDSFDGKIKGEQTARKEADSALGDRIAALEKKVPDEIRTGYSDDGVSIDLLHDEALLWSDTIEPATKKYAGVMSAEDKRHLDAALYQVEETDYFPDYVDTQIRGYDGDGHSVTVKAATKTEAGVMSSADKTALDALALYNAKSVITVAGMDFTHGDILDILKGHRPTRYAVKYETETSSYVCGILDAYTSRDGRIFTEIYTGGCDLAKDFTGGTHDSGRIYQFMRQYRIFGSGTPAAGTWSAWQSCLSSATMEELSAMGLDYEVFEGETDGYIEVKLTGKDGGVVGGSTEIPFASAAKSGFMSKEDKARLDGMETGANRTVVVQGYGDNAASVMSQAAVTQADNELLKRLQGVSDNSNPYTDPFVLVRFAGDDFLEQFNTWLDDLHTITSVSDARKAGFFRVNLYGSFCEVKNIVLSWEAMKFQQIVEGNVYIDGQGKVAFNDNRYTILQRRYDGSAWSEWQEDAYEIRKTIADDLRTAYTDKGVSLNLYNGDTRLFGDSIAAATQDKAGVMSAEDKRKLDEMKDTVVFTGATVDEETETLVLNRVDGETLVLDEVGGSLPGGITKVSQLENDKGYLTGVVDDERITLNND